MLAEPSTVTSSTVSTRVVVYTMRAEPLAKYGHLKYKSRKLDGCAHSLGIDEMTPHWAPSAPTNSASLDGIIVRYVRLVNPMIKCGGSEPVSHCRDHTRFS
jgi:hypothetical protein